MLSENVEETLSEMSTLYKISVTIKSKCKSERSEE